MTWDVTMFAVNLFALIGLGLLWRNVPDFLQRVVVGMLIASMMLFMWAACGQIAGWDPEWIQTCKALASAIEHLAVVAWVFRLVIVDQERRCLPNSSLRSPS